MLLQAATTAAAAAVATQEEEEEEEEEEKEKLPKEDFKASWSSSSTVYRSFKTWNIELETFGKGNEG